ncbi:bacterial low temperature requirement A protein-domain-containing protein [Naematelia encephala]|uniref:Bacterial low temperature requirement A protein-domain-containing protein n=1 Tax=Naematelia encephala TaxID=71784 RepID=A0A1Y2BD27_9TREE|nr:bacterial low temperature requirement A protein-domain-containing protein [Naematelia encephala]
MSRLVNLTTPERRLRPSPETKTKRSTGSVAQLGYAILPSPRQDPDDKYELDAPEPSEREVKRRSKPPNAVGGGGAIPFFRRPASEDAGPWLEEEHEATEWLSLFYDLTVVAVLTVFSSTHELESPQAIPTFLSYFTVIAWIWTSQVHYDTRYQAEDGWHRLLKFLQITVFIYMGAASGNWSPGMIQDPSVTGINGKLATEMDAAAESFATVLTAFAISRGLLATQYAVCAWSGKKAERRIASQLLSVTTLVISLLLTAVAIVVPRRTNAQVMVKIALLYVAIGLEIISVFLHMHKSLHRYIRTSAIAERYSAFSLIVLGEGFISITRAFNRAISGLSEDNVATYGQVWLAIAIIFLLWALLFGRFRKEDVIDQKRALLWEATHFPLHFGLLLLLAAIVNVIVVISFAQGINSVATEFFETVDAINNNQSLSRSDQSTVQRYLNRLTLEPSYQSEFELLNELANLRNPPQDPSILAYQYFGQILLETTIVSTYRRQAKIQSYGLEVSSETLSALEDLYAVNATNPSNVTLTEIRRDRASEYLVQVIRDPLDEALSGVLWLFPTAGAVLILIAVRSLSWHTSNTFANWVTHTLQITTGIALGLLGILDIGGRDVDVLASKSDLEGTNALYHILQKKWPLSIIVLAYGTVYFGSLGIVRCAREFCRGGKARNMA